MAADPRAASDFLACDDCGRPDICERLGECNLLVPPSPSTVAVPVRTLQPGDVTQEGFTVLRTSPHFGQVVVRFEGDDTLWRMHRDSLVRIKVPS